MKRNIQIYVFLTTYMYNIDIYIFLGREEGRDGKEEKKREV